MLFLYVFQVIRIWKEDDVLLDKTFKATVNMIILMYFKWLSPLLFVFIINLSLLSFNTGYKWHGHFDNIMAVFRKSCTVSWPTSFQMCWIFKCSSVFCPGAVGHMEGPLCCWRRSCGLVSERSCETSRFSSLRSSANCWGSLGSRWNH